MVYLFDDIEQFKEEDYSYGYKLLNQERRYKVDKFKYYKDKKLSVLAFLLLRYAVNKEYGISCGYEMEYGKYDKPKFKLYPKIHFNISHCASAVACIIDHKAVGIDVQNIVIGNDSLIDSVLTENEAIKVRNSENINAEFTKFWALKESYFKFKGTGITEAFDKIDFSESYRNEKFLLGDKVYISKRINDYFLAVCGDSSHDIKKVRKEHLLREI